MHAFLLAALLSFTPPTTERPRPIMALVTDVTSKGTVSTDRGTYVLAGLSVKNKAKTGQFLKEFLLHKVAKLELERGGAGAHVFVSSDCTEADKLMGRKSESTAGQCVRSLYVNEILLQKRWAAPAPQGVSLYKERLFPDKKR
jgi:hypothetical protein